MADITQKKIQEAWCCDTGHKEVSSSQMRDVCGPVLISTLPI